MGSSAQGPAGPGPGGVGLGVPCARPGVTPEDPSHGAGPLTDGAVRAHAATGALRTLHSETPGESVPLAKLKLEANLKARHEHPLIVPMTMSRCYRGPSGCRPGGPGPGRSAAGLPLSDQAPAQVEDLPVCRTLAPGPEPRPLGFCLTFIIYGTEEDTFETQRLIAHCQRPIAELYFYYYCCCCAHSGVQSYAVTLATRRSTTPAAPAQIMQHATCTSH